MPREVDEQRTALRSESVSGPNSAVREYAITTLSALHDPRDLEFLLDRLREDDVQDVAQECIEKDWGREAMPELIARVAWCEEDCLCLIEALEHVGDATAFKALAGKLGDADQTTAERAAGAIGAIALREGERAPAIALLERGRKATADPYVRKTIEATIRELRGG
jgi:HEAT repeat protein